MDTYQYRRLSKPTPIISFLIHSFVVLFTTLLIPHTAGYMWRSVNDEAGRGMEIRDKQTDRLTETDRQTQDRDISTKCAIRSQRVRPTPQTRLGY
ncbi:hypothetical protein ElyMa_006740700 [Elysia marginata]|uniref:Uncharacterized protein n=1 Tax=Elysia marginata TaxID=1093978 RepID=A0AAV4IX82_9GAST|nr:hypothetical protein ElyMa_006740700 [Elysia marginata]